MDTTIQVSHKKVMTILREPHDPHENKVGLILFGLGYMNILVKENEYNGRVLDIMNTMFYNMENVEDTDVHIYNKKMKDFCRHAMHKIMDALQRVDFLGETTTKQQTKIYEVAEEICNLCKE